MSWTAPQNSNKPLMPAVGPSSSGASSGSGSSSASSSKGSSGAASWLKEDTNFDDSDDPGRGGAGGGIPGQVDPEVPKMILYTRVINLVLSICMMTASILSLLTTTTMTTGVLGCYVVVFSCLLCCYETHLKQVSKMIALNFGFLYSAKSRSVFMLFIGTIMFSFSLFGKLIGILMLANAGFNVYVLVKYPDFEDAQRSDAQAEIQDFLASNPAYARRAMSFGFAAATTAAANQGLFLLVIKIFFLFLPSNFLSLHR
jgi:hypothetical protein